MRRLRDGLISIGIAAAMLAILELTLRFAGFHHEIAPMSLRFGYPNPREIVDVFRPDPLLFWRMRAGSVFDAEAPVPINAAGYRGPLPEATRASGSYRIAIMGDSVAFGASTSFPEMLEKKIRTELPGSVEVLNFGVPGYTIVQGLRQFDAEVAILRPDVVVIAYGWNDHWLAKNGLTDEQRHPPTGRAVRLAQLVARLRVAQALRFVIDKHGPHPDPIASATARVPLQAYRASVAAFIEKVKSIGATPVVLGLPSGLAEGEFPEYLLASGFAHSRSEALIDHRDYVEAAGQECALHLTEFVDLQPSFEAGGRIVPGLFRGDKIHMTDAGNARIVESIEPFIVGRSGGAG